MIVYTEGEAAPRRNSADVGRNTEIRPGYRVRVAGLSSSEMNTRLKNKDRIILKGKEIKRNKKKKKYTLKIKKK